MCTAVTYRTKDFYFGRTLDYPFSYGEEIVVTPRGYSFEFGCKPVFENCYAIVGMAHVENSYPLYYDAVNEAGLCMAGLNFVGNACFGKEADDANNVVVFEFIPYVLRQCGCVKEAKEIIQKINLTDTPFSSELLAAPLHWLIADRNEAVTVEAVAEGVKIYANPVGVLTNNPPFDEQLFALNNYMRLSVRPPVNTFSPKLELKAYSHGMGAMGLPGDLSSQSRFVRAAFTKMNSLSGETEKESVGQFFHILETVSQTRGCCDTGGGEYEITLYTSCCNADKGIYYCTTYGNRQITAVDMNREDLSASRLVRFAPVDEEQIRFLN